MCRLNGLFSQLDGDETPLEISFLLRDGRSSRVRDGGGSRMSFKNGLEYAVRFLERSWKSSPRDLVRVPNDSCRIQASGLCSRNPVCKEVVLLDSD